MIFIWFFVDFKVKAIDWDRKILLWRSHFGICVVVIKAWLIRLWYFNISANIYKFYGHHHPDLDAGWNTFIGKQQTLWHQCTDTVSLTHTYLSKAPQPVTSSRLSNYNQKTYCSKSLTFSLSNWHTFVSVTLKLHMTTDLNTSSNSLNTGLIVALALLLN